MGGGGGVRVDVNEELMFFRELKKNWGGGGVGLGGGGGSGCRVDVNEELKFLGKFTKKNSGGWGGGGGSGGEGSGWGVGLVGESGWM